jgi:endonuclease-8
MCATVPSAAGAGGGSVPEGPEIRLAADRIARVLVDCRLRDVELTLPPLRPFRARLIDAGVTAVDTRGKAMLTRFDNGLTLYSHNQLYGRWYVTRRDRTPKTGRSLRVALHTETHSAWLYSASDIEILDDDQLRSHPFLNRIGPDVLDASLLPSDVCSRLEETQFRRRSLASLYLDQSFMAGIGNYLRSEILFTARAHPSTRPMDMSRPARMTLARMTLEVSRRAYELRGVTVTRKLAASLKKSGQRYSQYRHWVFGRSGKSCRRCETAIVRNAVAGRAVYSCPSCQPSESSGTDGRPLHG